MDPFRNIFAFISNDDTKEEEEVENFLKDKKTEKKKPGLPKSNKTCFLCEEGEIHDECTNIKKVKTKGKKADGKYVCDKCEYTSDNRICLKSHKEAIHLKIKHFRCSVCFYEKYRKNEIESHMKSKHKGKQCRVLIIGCPICERKETHGICVKQPQKNNHQNGKTDGKYVCDKCEYTSDMRKNMRIHAEALHLKIKHFRCSVCFYEKYRKHEMESHMKSKHKDKQCRVLIIGCPICERNETHEICVKQPPKNNHQNRKTDGEYGCDKCEYSCDKKMILRSHIKLVHLKVKKYKCSACSYSSYTRQRLQVHVKRIHKDNTCRIIKVGCSLCETNHSHKFCERKYEFYDRKRKTHVRIKKNGRGPKDKCRIKPKSTKKDAINNEEAPALKSTLLFCEDCGDSFDNIEQLKDHESNSHSDITRFSCNLCDYMGYFKVLLVKHQNDMHEGLASRVIKIGCEKCEENIEGHECDSKIDALNEDLRKTVKIEGKKDASLNYSKRRWKGFFKK